MSRIRKTLWHTSVYMFGIVADRGVALIFMAVYTRVFGEASGQFAVWDVSTATVQFLAPVFELGLASALVRFYHQYPGKAERESAVHTVVTFVFLSVLVFTLITFLFVRPLAAFVFDSDNAVGLMRLVILIASATVLGTMPLSLLRAKEKSMHFAALNLIRAFVGSIAILILLFQWRSAEAILLGDLIGLSAMALFGFIICARDLRPRIDRAVLKRMLSFSLPIVPFNIAVVILFMSDRYFLVDAIGLEEMAVYSLGFRIAMIMALFTRAMQTAWPPSAFQLANEPGGKQTLAQMLRIVLLGLAVLALGLTVYAPELVRVFAPEDIYAGAYRFIPWVAFSYALQMGVFYLLTNLLIVHKTIWQPVVMCIGAGCKLALNAVLIGRYGILGAAAGTLISFALMFALSYAVAQRHYPVPYDLRRISGLLIITACIAAAATWAGSMQNLGGFAFRTFLLLLFPVVVFTTQTVTTKERLQLWDAVRARLGRLRP